MRGSRRKQVKNRTIKSRLKSLERRYADLLKAGKKDEANSTLREVASAFDKAAKSGVIHSATASRKKSRLTRRLAREGAAPAAPAKS